MHKFIEPLAKPLAWLLAFFYDLTRSYGFAVILLTLAVMLVVMPLTIKGTRSMMAMQKYQPEIRRLQTEFKGDRQRLNEELLGFYRENGINPMGSCLPLLVQAPVFIGLYQAIKGITELREGTFSPDFVSETSELYKSLVGKTQMLFLGVDLSRSAANTLKVSFLQALPYLLIIAIATATSYVQQKQVSGRSGSVDMNPTQKTLMRVLPLTMAVFSFTLPAALGLYLATSNCFRVAQQWYIGRALYGNENGEAGGEVIVTTAKPAKPKAEKPAAPAKPRVSGRITPAKQGGTVSSGKAGPSTPADERASRKSRAPSDGGSGSSRRRQPFGPKPEESRDSGTNDDKRRG